MAGIRREDFGNVDRADDPQAMLNYLDTVSGLATVKDYKRQSFELLKIRPGQIVLDVGCGTGDDARLLAARVAPGGRVIGVDDSKVAIAEANGRSAGSTDPVEFRPGDALALEFETADFDGARADRLFQHLDHPDRALQELVRVTRPGGAVVVSDVDWDTMLIDSPDLRIARQVARTGADALRNGCIGRHLRAMLLDAGLTDVEVRAVAMTLTDFALADQLLNVTRSSETAVKAGSIAADRAAWWLDQLRGADRSGRFFCSLNAYVVGGRKPGTD